MPPKPPSFSRRDNLKGDPPPSSETKENLTKKDPFENVALNFSVPAEFKKNFKVASAIACITQSELLQRAFKLWCEKNG